MSNTATCRTHVSLLKDELNAWSQYWNTLFERTVSQEKIESLRQEADAASAALRAHTALCSLCRKPQSGPTDLAA
jgi:transcription elongation factor GreA-like protein